MIDDKPLDRRCKLLRMLMSSHYGVTLRDMAHELEVSPKTILRDLKGLAKAGFPPCVEIRDHDHGCKRWRLLDRGKLPPLMLHFDEASALILAIRSLDPLAGTHYWKAARNALAKLRTELGPEALRYLDKVSQQFHHAGNHFGRYSDKAHVIETLAAARDECRRLDLEYQSMKANAPSWREVHPYGLARYKDSLYLVAYAPDHGEVRDYKVDRVSNATLKPETFTPLPDFNMDAHFAGKWGIHGGDREIQVRIRFQPQVARYVLETARHPSQVLTPLPDGGLLAQFNLSTTIEIKSWILSFGPSAMVLEPPELRAEIQADLERLLEAYKTDPTDASPTP